MRAASAAIAALVCIIAAPATADAQRLPEIRTTQQNRVPACATPERLQSFLAERNERLDPRFANIAQFYKQHGDATRVRWDYAFFQMMLETNALKFGRDVSPRQNNFAGLGATGGGVPGERFKDVSTGVLAHLQHLVAYSGEEVERPAAQRTAENQSDIIAKSRRLGRPMTFSDLTNRWAMDRGYARKIDAIAEEFRDQVCARAPAPSPTAEALPSPPPAIARTPARRAPDSRANPAPAPQIVEEVPKPSSTATGSVAVKTVPRQPASAPAPPTADTDAKPACSVLTASFGGTVTLLIKATGPDQKITYTALGVIEGQEQTMAKAYMTKHAPGGAIVGQFMSREAAVTQAYQKCDSGRH